jgi:Protein of unknown function (DUF1585)
LMTYALGRTVDYRDMPAIRAIVKRAQADNLRMSALILGVVQSAAFRQGDAGSHGTLSAKLVSDH